MYSSVKAHILTMVVAVVDGLRPMRNLILPFVITAILIVVVFLLFGSFEQSTTQALEKLKSDPFQFTLYSFPSLVSDIVLPIPSSIVMYLNG